MDSFNFTALNQKGKKMAIRLERTVELKITEEDALNQIETDKLKLEIMRRGENKKGALEGILIRSSVTLKALGQTSLASELDTSIKMVREIFNRKEA